MTRPILCAGETRFSPTGHGMARECTSVNYIPTLSSSLFSFGFSLVVAELAALLGLTSKAPALMCIRTPYGQD
jgi:hypothetical protein